MGESKGICPDFLDGIWGWVLLDPQTSKFWPPKHGGSHLWRKGLGLLVSKNILVIWSLWNFAGIPDWKSIPQVFTVVPVVSSSCQGIYNWNIPKNLGVFTACVFSHLQAVMLLFPSKPRSTRTCKNHQKAGMLEGDPTQLVD